MRAKNQLTKKIKDAWNRFKFWKRNLTKVKYIFIVYILIVLIATMFLVMPFSHFKNTKISFFDALFTSMSAFSDTGLVVKNTYETWTVFGQAIIAFMIFVGGLGIFALKIFIFNYLFKQNDNELSDMELVSRERGTGAYGNHTSSLVVSSIIVLLSIMVIAGFGLTLYFYFIPPKPDPAFPLNFDSPYKNINMSFRYGFFHSISALNNAGFDIISNQSLAPYFGNYGLQVIFIILLFMGGLGYPVIYDTILFIKSRINKKNQERKFRFSLFTKLSLSSYFMVLTLGIIFTLIFELTSKDPNTFWNNNDLYLNNESKYEKIWALIFMNFSTRSAGFATINLQHLTKPTMMLFSFLMFLGAAPASTGGGVRTTTLAIVILGIFSKILGRPSIRAFRRKIDDETVKMSQTVFILTTFLILFSSIIMSSSLSTYNGAIDTSNFGFLPIIFEACSAFGTCGLTIGITDKLNITSKITLLFLMFIGQFGVSSTLLVWGNKKNYAYKYEYVSESVAIG